MSLFTLVGILTASILLPGTFHGDEVPAESDGNWLALVSRDGTYILETVKVEVEPVTDPLLDYGNERSGREVIISPDVDPVILIRGVEGVVAGYVPTVLASQHVEPSRPLTADLPGQSYRFSIDCAKAFEVEEQPQKKCVLVLASLGGVEHLASYTRYQQDGSFYWASEATPLIIWAGDLDGDGKLDVLLETSDHYNVAELSLYLSNGRNNGFGKPMVFRTVGC